MGVLSWFCILVFQLGFVSQVYLLPQNLGLQRGSQCSLNYNFDYVLFAIQWPPSFCARQSTCARHDNSWSIHGIWPQYANGSWPQYCCFDRDFDVANVQHIRSQLEQKWKSLKASNDHQLFWQHEWKKHGTCARDNQELQGQRKYFEKTLELFDNFQLKEWLAAGGVKPSNSRVYSLLEIHGAIESQLGAKVELECLPKRNNQLPLLQHVYVCLNRQTLLPVSCLRNDDNQCGRGHVQYPSAQKNLFRRLVSSLG